MKIHSVGATLAALAVLISSTAIAQPRDDRNGQQQHQGRQNHGQAQKSQNRARAPSYRQPVRQDIRAMQNAPDHDERGAGPDHQFRRGQRMPAQYRTNQYVVDDWRGHHLTQPPRGYHWVQSGGDYILVAIATGIILQLLLNQ
jgi:Ni/Co efflux regulator RcnB